MYILGVETTGPVGSVALMDLDSGKIISHTTEKPLNHLIEIMPLARRLKKKYGIASKDIGAVAISVGPGSFTGIRIGVAIGKAMGQALDIPVLSVGSLDAFRLESKEGLIPVVIFNARRGQVYAAIFDESGNELMPPGPYMLTDVYECIEKKQIPKEKICWFGDGIDAYDIDDRIFRLAQKNRRYQNAERVVKLGAMLLREGKGQHYSEIKPDYMRRAEAEVKLQEGKIKL